MRLEMSAQSSRDDTVAPAKPRQEFIPALVASLSDQEVYEMDRDGLITVLNRHPSPCLDRRVKRRLKYFDGPTLRRLLFLCRQCERNRTQFPARSRRVVPP